MSAAVVGVARLLAPAEAAVALGWVIALGVTLWVMLLGRLGGGRRRRAASRG